MVHTHKYMYIYILLIFRWFFMVQPVKIKLIFQLWNVKLQASLHERERERKRVSSEIIVGKKSNQKVESINWEYTIRSYNFAVEYN